MDREFGTRLALTAAAAVAAESTTFPIDITKTRLQLQGEGTIPNPRSSYRGTLGTVIGIARDEGLCGLYRGLSPALLRHVFYTSIRIGAYEQMRKYSSWHSSNENSSALGGDDRAAHSSVANKAFLGGASGIIGQVVASPADLIKVRMQADGRLAKLGQPPRYSGVADALYKIISAEGVLGLWRGVGPNAQRAFLVNMGELACYDHAKHSIIHSGFADDNVLAHSLASLLSGLSATLLSCPADVVKTRMMNAAAESTYSSSIDCLAKTVRREGVMALWKGFLPTWIRLGPWQFVFWVSYEQLRRVTGLPSF